MRAPPRSDEGFWSWYAAYLQTDEWRDRRAQVLARAKGMCEGCGAKVAREVHHLTYQRVGHEMLFDLAAVCDDCHHAIHGEKPRRITPPATLEGCTCVGSFTATSCPHHGVASVMRHIANNIVRGV